MSKLTNQETAILNKYLSRWTDNIINNIRGAQRPAPSTASGKTERAMRYEVDVAKGVGTIYGPSYVFVLETGRGPGKFPPMNVIREWVRAKLGVPEEEADGVAFVIARKIAEEGSAQFKAPGNSGTITSAIPDSEIAALTDEIAASRLTAISGELGKFLQKL